LGQSCLDFRMYLRITHAIVLAHRGNSHENGEFEKPR